MRSAHFAPDYVPLEPSNGALSSKDAAAVTTGAEHSHYCLPASMHKPLLCKQGC